MMSAARAWRPISGLTRPTVPAMSRKTAGGRWRGALVGPAAPGQGRHAGGGRGARRAGPAGRFLDRGGELAEGKIGRAADLEDAAASGGGGGRAAGGGSGGGG